jgi:hypothetical protein
MLRLYSPLEPFFTKAWRPERDRTGEVNTDPISRAMKTKHATALIAVVLGFIVGTIPGFAQEGASSPASEP